MSRSNILLRAMLVLCDELAYLTHRAFRCTPIEDSGRAACILVDSAVFFPHHVHAPWRTVADLIVFYCTLIEVFSEIAKRRTVEWGQRYVGGWIWLRLDMEVLGFDPEFL